MSTILSKKKEEKKRDFSLDRISARVVKWTDDRDSARFALFHVKHRRYRRMRTKRERGGPPDRITRKKGDSQGEQNVNTGIKKKAGKPAFFVFQEKSRKTGFFRFFACLSRRSGKTPSR
jgi:hypothetical protein